MTPVELVQLALKISIVLIVFALGLKADFSDLSYVLGQPRRLARSLLAMTLIMPVAAVLLAKAMALPNAAAAALVALSLAPVPPLLPRKQLKAGGRASYAIGLLVAASLVAIVWMPIAIGLLDPLFPASLRVSVAPIASLALLTILAPLAAGFIVRRLAPSLADWIAPFASALGSTILVLAIAAMATVKWRVVFAQAHDGTLLAFATFAVVGLIVGHVLGGPDPDDRTVLATATASRHPGIAIAVAQMNFPGDQTIAAAVLLYLAASTVVSIPYVRWRSACHKAQARFGSERPHENQNLPSSG